MNDQAQWLTFAALLVAALAIPATIWATRRWGNRRARLAMSIEVAPILPAENPTALAVTFADFPVPDPHLVNFEIRNVGPRDVPTTAFDAQQALTVHFSSAVYGVTRSVGRVVGPAVGERPPNAVVRLEPHLMKRGESWSFTAVVSGGGAPRVESPLVDTDIIQTAPGPAQTVTVDVLGIGVKLPLPRRKLKLKT